FMEDRRGAQPAVEFSKAPSLFLALVLLLFFTLLLGVFPGGFIEAARGSVQGLL
ncbi:MAG: hypothetical protein HYU38_12635, partial [Candidatus Tectomicrobia bacterium]|nr:hypothetical protein [Candidatus Tectomicrobia bacterium]